MCLFIFFALFIVGSSAQNYLVQNHFSDLVNKCNSQINAVQNTFVNLIRDRYFATANEFPKFVATLTQARALVGSSGANLFTPIDNAISTSYNKLTSDFNDYWLRQDFKSILDTITEGFFNVRQVTINDYKKLIEKVLRRTECYFREREAIRTLIEDFCLDAVQATQDAYNEWEDDVEDIQSQLSAFRNALGGELKACGNRDCILKYVRKAHFVNDIII